ncbi:2-amino-3,7-dideoxy-D-threo-hept-6-ulosonate synthase [Allorhizocola rhizosphaerae]|uniref:2-amino-3,7-dideoxy-D-threo-hept-6-ulosonate synthase n=1 Tax=Allorhizocola rhizosphaerae TaxID=1872709 RepID=UPI000E3E8775|nr:2-amino-3,7-dideoxy-D-threo-hept-6-ulosonate synthase [Allorhizocola rhizosphaerae]
MLANDTWGKTLRLARLSRHADSRMFIVPMDHSVTNGPIMPAHAYARMLDSLAGCGVDAVVMHKGRLRYLQPDLFTRMALIVHLSASTAHGPDPDAKVLVGTVEEALRRGADAVSLHVNMGSAQERRQLRDLGTVAEAADRCGIPVMAMMYPRGPKIADAHDPELVAHAATIAVDLGADIVKTVYTGSTSTMADVVRSCPAPIVVAGGPPLADRDAILTHVRAVRAAGAAGVAMGRNVFQADNPAAVADAVAAVVHDAPAEPAWATRPLQAIPAAR